jgi:hypothetical protein
MLRAYSIYCSYLENSMKATYLYSHETEEEKETCGGKILLI